MAFDAAIEQLRRAHSQDTKDLAQKVQSQAEELSALRSQLNEARAETEDYKTKYAATKASLKRYAEKFDTWMANIKKAKQKKRDGSSASHIVDLESNDSTDPNLLTPPVAKSNVDRSAATSSTEKAPKKARNSVCKSSPIVPLKSSAKSDLAAEFPTDTPPDDVLAPVLALNAPLPRAPASSPALAPPAAAGMPYKYVEVVRKKKDREQLPATDCEQCKQFLDAVTNGSTALDRSSLVNMCSRHRARFERPPTPPGFWDLSFPQGGSKDDG